MDMRTTKRIIYGAFYLGIWFLIFLAIYRAFLYTAPSCFDNIQNQGEAGVDCGGPCAKACIPKNLSTISPLASPRIFVAIPGHYTFLVQVANTNTGYVARGFEYSFDVYDASETLIASVPGRSFMYGTEVKYLIAPNIAISSGTVDHAVFALGNVDWAPDSALDLIPRFDVQNLGPGVSTPTTVSVNGQLTDNDASAFSNILVIAVFKDASGNPIGASQTVIDSIAPGETRPFSVLYPSNTDLAPALTSFYAYASRT